MQGNGELHEKCMNELCCERFDSRSVSHTQTFRNVAFNGGLSCFDAVRAN